MRRDAASTDLGFQDPTPPPDVEELKPDRLEPRQINLAESGENTAFLCVVEGTEGTYQIWAACAALGDARWRVAGDQNLRFTDAMPPAKSIVRKMSRYSKDSALRPWLNKLRQRRNDVCLYIADTASTGIPWELFKLKDIGRDYLGSAITTIRWVPPHENGRPPKREREICRGGVLSHVDPVEGNSSGIAGKHGSLQEPLSDILELANRLREECSGYAMVYMFCHGLLVESDGELGIGSQKDRHHRLHLGRLRETKLRMLQHSRAVVFLNACSAGGSFRDGSLGGTVVHGFSEVFLDQGARGFIGPVGAVRVKQAADFAQRFFDVVRKPDAPPVAEVLRDLRREAAAAMPQDDMEELTEEYEKLYYTFLYVFYGNPGLRLVLCDRPSGSTSSEDEP